MQDVNPPVNTNPTVPVPIDVDIGFVLLLFAGLFVILWYFYRRYQSAHIAAGADVRTPIEKMMYSGWSPNKMMAIQFGVIFPAMFGILFGVQMMISNVGVGILMILLSSVGTTAPYFYLKDRSREKTRNRYKLSGYLWKKDGVRIKYDFSNVDFRTEMVLSNKEEEDLYEQNPEWVKTKELDNVHVIPTVIDDKHLIYLLMKRPLSDTFEWVNDEDYDYYGTITIKSDGPELREVATLHRIGDNPEEELFHVNEYVPTLLVLWDAGQTKDSTQQIVPIDVTTDTVLAGLIKQIGAEVRTSAGELNSITQQVMVLENEDKDVDDLSQTLARKKAHDFINAEKRLTMFDLGMLGSVSTLMAIIFSILTFALGYAIGG